MNLILTMMVIYCLWKITQIEDLIEKEEGDNGLK